MDMPMALQALEHFLGMSAISKGCVQSGLARLYLKEIQDFLNHDGNVHAHRGASLADYLGNGFRIFLRLQFFIFLIVFLGVGSLVSDTPLVFLGRMFLPLTLMFLSLMLMFLSLMLPDLMSLVFLSSVFHVFLLMGYHFTFIRIYRCFAAAFLISSAIPSSG